MRKFIEYFAVVGIKEENYIKLKLGDTITPVVLQLIPEEIIKEFPFPAGLSEFCLPDGWNVYGYQRKPTFYSTVLTGLDGSKSYIASLACFESISSYLNNEENTSEIDLYVPKAFCFVSRLAFFDNFRECLALLVSGLCEIMNTTSSATEPFPERLLSKLLYAVGSVEPGNKSISLPLDDRNTLVIYPSLIETIPKTDDCVSVLFKLVGIYNLTRLFTALLLDNKILFVSKSYAHLYKSTKGLISLLYPLEYSYVFIPILPTRLIEILSAPTPFLVGFHSSCQLDYENLKDVLIMNLDNGELISHASLNIPQIPEPYYRELFSHLVELARPELNYVDEVYADSIFINPKLQDKKIRACFFITMVKILAGYRPCITYIRLFPKPVMKFHAELFIERREIKDSDFFMKLFNTTSFNEFIGGRGPTWREYDYFDYVMNEVGYSWSNKSSKEQFSQLTKCTDSFYNNEPSCDPKNPSSKIQLVDLWPKFDFSHIKIRLINISRVNQYIRNVEKPVYTLNRKMEERKSKIPLDPSPFYHGMIFYVGYRRLELIQECVSLIFSNKIPDARKVLPSVLQTLSSKSCQFALLNELSKFTSKEKSLELHQFNLISRLLNTILTYSKNRTCYSPIAMVIKYGNHFYTHVKDNVQYMYTSIQQHQVFRDLVFWENLFCYEAQRSLVILYGPKYTMEEIESVFPQEDYLKGPNASIKDQGVIIHSDLNETLKAIGVADKELSSWSKLKESERETIRSMELSYLYSQIIDLIHRMSYMLVDFETVNIVLKESDRIIRESSVTSNDKRARHEKITEIITLMNKLVANINHMIGLKQENLASLRELTIHLVNSQFEALEPICRAAQKSEDKKLTFRYEPRLCVEEIVQNSYPAYFYVDRLPALDYDRCGSFSLLPAEGFLFVTNKNVIFKGYPIDMFLSDFCTNITVPLNLILKLKSYSCDNLKLADDLYFYSQFFFKLKNNFAFYIAFPKDTTPDSFDQAKKFIKNGISELKGLSIKKTILSTNRHRHDTQSNISAVLNNRKNFKLMRSDSKVNQYTPALPIDFKEVTTPTATRRNRDKTANRYGTMFKNMTNKSSVFYQKIVSHISNNMGKTLEPISEFKTELYLPLYSNILVLEWTRMGFISENKSLDNSYLILSLWRVSQFNIINRISLNIPRLNIVPKFMSDDSIIKFMKNYTHGRIPLLAWSYPLSTNPEIQNSSILMRSEAPVKSATHLTSTKIESSSKASLDPSTFILAINSSNSIARSKSKKNKCTIEMIAKQASFESLYTLNTRKYDIESWLPVSFYIFFDKSFQKGTLKDLDINCVHYDPPSSNAIKKAYLSYQEAFIPASSGKDVKTINFYEQIGISSWFSIISGYLNLALSMAFLSDICYSSSLISMSDGVETTSIAISIAQILLDPHYRTFKGFQNLIEKDWLEYNFNFFGRNNSNFCPIFILFLDIVYQLTVQFPDSFEFNTFYLSFIGYHNFSTKFDTFMIGDSIVEETPEELQTNAGELMPINPMDNGDISETVSKATERSNFYIDETTGYLNDITQSQSSIFKYIQSYIEVCTVFNNMSFNPNNTSVLYPSSMQSSMEIWPFYYVYNFQEESLFNLESLSEHAINVGDTHLLNLLKSKNEFPIKEEEQTVLSAKSFTPTYGYIGDGTPFVLDKISWLLFDINAAHDELDQHAQPLNDILLDSIKFSPISTSIISSERQTEFFNIRSIVYSITELSNNIKSESAEKSSVSSHIFNKDSTNSMHTCQVCAKIITNFGAALLCAKCGVAVHTRCRLLLSTTCLSGEFLTGEGRSVTEMDKTLNNWANFTEDEFFVRGKLCVLHKNKKKDKYSIFVLSKSHQTIHSYPPSEKDKKNISIASSEVLSCKLNPPSLSSRKSYPECGFFEVVTKKKTYKIVSSTNAEAEKWVTAINSFILSNPTRSSVV